MILWLSGWSSQKQATTNTIFDWEFFLQKGNWTKGGVGGSEASFLFFFFSLNYYFCCVGPAMRWQFPLLHQEIEPPTLWNFMSRQPCKTLFGIRQCNQPVAECLEEHGYKCRLSLNPQALSEAIHHIALQPKRTNTPLSHNSLTHSPPSL